MDGGYVLDFSNPRMENFFQENFEIEIYNPKYDRENLSASKANRLRAIWEDEDDLTVGKIIYALIDYMEVSSLTSGKEISQNTLLLIQKAKDIAGLEEKEAQLTDLILTEQSDDLKQSYRKQLKRVANEIKEAQTSPEKIDLSIPYRTAFDLATKMLKNPYSAWESMDVFEQHRLFFFIFEEKLPYNHLTGYRTDDIPLTTRLFEDFAEQNSQYVDLTRIGLVSLQCECSVLPLYYKPLFF